MSDYPYIRAWGIMMHSYPYYIKAQVEQARKENAPKDAIYRDPIGTWHTFDRITSPTTRATIERIREQMT